MREDEGLALYEAANSVAGRGPLLEIGSYCGKSAIYLGAAAAENDQVLYSIDHHRGSEEHQVGEEYHDPRLVDPISGRIDTLPAFRATIAEAALEGSVIAVVGPSATIAASWATPLALVFIDGGHAEATSSSDYEAWAPKVLRDGLLAIHDVFDDPNAGGRGPYLIYERALASSAFDEVASQQTLRVLARVDDGL